jgi:IS5 family transposase
MRKRIVSQLALFDQSIHQLTSLIRPSAVLRKMDRVLSANPEIVDLIHADLTGNASEVGANGMSAEQVLRTAILRQMKQYSWRELADRLHDGISLRWFTRFYSAETPHFTTLQKAVTAISDESWQRINDLLVEFAKEHKIEKGRTLRTDTTVVETNVPYPRDSRLLWDGIRVLTRIMARIRHQRPDIDFGFANRKRKSKRLCYQIALVKGPKADKTRRKLYRRLIKVANEVFDMGCRCYHQLSGCDDVPKEYWQLDHYLTMMAPAIDQCERRILKGENVDASEKIVSIFEEHTDIIRRGKSSSSTEFGHKVLFTAGKTGLITQYKVLLGNPGDGDFLSKIITTHKRQFGRAPHGICADRRFFSEDNEAMAYREGIKQVSICKPGYRSKQRKQIEKERWFKNLQKFRAGIEGIISTLMRGYGLKRCIWKGWKAFKRYVALSVVTFNLKKIAMLL